MTESMCLSSVKADQLTLILVSALNLNNVNCGWARTGLPVYDFFH